MLSGVHSKCLGMDFVYHVRVVDQYILGTKHARSHLQARYQERKREKCKTHATRETKSFQNGTLDIEEVPVDHLPRLS